MLETITVAASTPDFIRKGEGDLIELRDGRLLLVYMEFSGEGDDFARTRIVAKESYDLGKTWHHHRVIAETPPEDINIHSPNLIRDQDGAILLVFHHSHAPGRLPESPLLKTYTMVIWRSTDEGEHFSFLRNFMPNRGFNLCNGVIKRARCGRLLLPVAHNHSPDYSGDAQATLLYSDDDGIHWHESRNRVMLPMRGAMEPHVEETEDGRLLMVLRNQLGALFIAVSTDSGASWLKPQTTGLSSPEACPELTRIPSTGDLLMIWNHSPYDPLFRSHFGRRSPLTAAISKDQGKTWTHFRNIEEDSSRAFSNPSCRFLSNGMAIVNYWTCHYTTDDAIQDVIDLKVARIDTSWFYQTEA